MATLATLATVAVTITDSGWICWHRRCGRSSNACTAGTCAGGQVEHYASTGTNEQCTGHACDCESFLIHFSFS
jgi:hypothetical protein